MQFDLRTDLTAIKIAAKAQIDAEAERARLLYITPGSGQALVYAAKLDEACRFVAEQHRKIEKGSWPFLEAEVGITGAEMIDVANDVIAASNKWNTTAVEIERLRLIAKHAVDASTNGAEIAIASKVKWP